MNNIDYADLYGVKSGESDFSGAIKRSLKTGPKYFGKIMIETILYREKHPQKINK